MKTAITLTPLSSLPTSAKQVKLPEYSDPADIDILTTDFENVANAINQLDENASAQNQARKELSSPDLLDDTIPAGLYYVTSATNTPGTQRSGYLTVTTRSSSSSTIRIHTFQGYNSFNQYMTMRRGNSEWTEWSASTEFNTLKIKPTSTNASNGLLAWGDPSTDSSANIAGIMYYYDAGSFTLRTKNRSNLDAIEDYKIPANTSSSNGTTTYDIITTKTFDASTFTASSTLVNNVQTVTFEAPASNKHALVGFAGSFTHIFHNGGTSTTVYSSGGYSTTEWEITRSNSVYAVKRIGSPTTAFNLHVLWF